ncbi:helix-turn-helix domain-containing protein [Leekyejoonella antrihumi]|nr:XRE family transcriptional regulator [Leekyejoonella antrihumi]
MKNTPALQRTTEQIPSATAEPAATVHSRGSSHATRIDDHVTGIVGSIGAKVRHLRKSQRLSLQQLAVKADVSAAAIHKVERSDMVPTVTTLLKIAAALDCSVGYFIGDDRLSDPVAFTPAAHREDVFTPHTGLHLAGISGPYSPFHSAAAMATVEPGADSGGKLLAHPGEELVFVVSGGLTFDIGGSEYVLRRGDSLHFLGDQPHHWANVRKTSARAVWYVLRDS